MVCDDGVDNDEGKIDTIFLQPQAGKYFNLILF
jgi:hypothetical protein